MKTLQPAHFFYSFAGIILFWIANLASTAPASVEQILSLKSFQPSISTPTASYSSDPCRISSFAWSADKSLLALGCQKGGIYIYDPISWQEIQYIKTSGRTETDSVQSLMFTTDGQTLFYVLWNQLWKVDIASKKQNILTEKYFFQIGVYGNQILPSPNGSGFTLLSVSQPEDGVRLTQYHLSIWDLKGKEIFKLTSDRLDAETISNMAYNSSGSLLAAASFDNSVWVWNTVDGELIKKLEGHASDVYDVTFNSTNNMLISAGADATVRFWNPYTWKTVRVLKGFNTEIHHVMINSTGSMMILGLNNGEIQVWPLDKDGLPGSDPTMKWQVKPQPRSDYFYEPALLKQMSFGVNENQLLTLNGYGDLILWDMANTNIQRAIIQPTVTAFPSSTVNPTQISQLTATITPLPTSSPTPGPVRETTPFPTPLYDPHAISSETLKQLTLQYELQKGQILSSTWSPDGKLLAIAESRGLRLYSSADWSLKNTLSEGEAVSSIVFSHDGNLVAYCLEGHDIVVMDIKNDQKMYSFPSYCAEATLEFNSSDQVLTKSYNWFGERWDLKTGQLIKEEQRDFSIITSPDEKYSASSIASGNGESTAIRIVGRTTNEIVQVIEKSGGASSSGQLLFSPDGSHFVVVRRGMHWIRTMAITTARYTDNDIQFWRVNPDGSFTLLSTIVAGERMAFSFSPDGKILAIAYPDRDLELWDPTSGRRIKELPIRGTFIQLNSQGQLLVLHEHQEAEVWQLQGGSATRVWKLDGFGQQSDIALSTGLLAAATSYEIKLWNLTGLKINISPYKIIHTAYSINEIAVSPDGSSLASNGEKGAVIIWDPSSGRQTIPLSGHPFNWSFSSEGYVYSLAYSPDGSLLASVGSDYKIRLWRVSDGHLINEFNPMEAFDLLFSPDGQLLANSGSETTRCSGGECNYAKAEIELWNIKEQNQLRTLDFTGKNIAFSTDAAMLATVNTTTGQAQIFDVNNGTLINTWKINKGVTQVFFSPDGRHLITVHGQSIKFWDWHTGWLVAVKEFSYPIFQTKLSSDGKTLMVSYTNGIIEVWGIAT